MPLAFIPTSRATDTSFELEASLPLTETGLLNTRPVHGEFGGSDPRILVPGDAEQSLIWRRMIFEDGEGRMPHIALTVADHQSLEMLKRCRAPARGNC